MTTVRRLAAMGVAAAGLEAVLSAADPVDPTRRRLIVHLAPSGVPSTAHVLVVLAGLALLVLAPKVWRGARTAASLAVAGLVLLAVLNLLKGLEYEEAALELGLALLLLVGLRAFPMGSRNRPRAMLVWSGVAAWALAYGAVLFGPLASNHRRTIRRELHHAIKQALSASLGRAHLTGAWV